MGLWKADERGSTGGGECDAQSGRAKGQRELPAGQLPRQEHSGAPPSLHQAQPPPCLGTVWGMNCSDHNQWLKCDHVSKTIGSLNVLFVNWSNDGQSLVSLQCAGFEGQPVTNDTCAHLLLLLLPVLSHFRINISENQLVLQSAGHFREKCTNHNEGQSSFPALPGWKSSRHTSSTRCGGVIV